MAYQDVKRALIEPSRSTGRSDDPNVQGQIDYLHTQLQRLSQEVVVCHNLVQQFGISIANGLTTVAVTMPAKMPDANYFVGASASFNSGGVWVTAKTTTGFTLNWATATVGSQSARLLIVG